MAIRRIYETPDPVLRQISKPVTAFDASLKTLVDDMYETIERYGLSDVVVAESASGDESAILSALGAARPIDIGVFG